ncbi:allantoicase [Rhizopogon vinicolor AM-OR11-026]|uniref:Allantoicase n=1 Tax=Rhizopogon vinicolor AM-OR11-026 TaxID=1314800 RepID=A0A1B7NBW9_9AGAM|nr:allantoicase [Rhizopogon vinicolor AM-OR11-026]
MSMRCAMAYEVVALEDFHRVFGSTTELSSVSIGGQVVNVSDEFFAEAYQLLLVEPPASLAKQYGPNGELYSGWETRRHNPTYDWCTIRLGTTGTITGFDIDTTHFNGNEAPEASVDVAYEFPSDWKEVFPKVRLGPSRRHLYKIPATGRTTYVRLRIYPDGGIARFRVYGHVVPVFPVNPAEPFDLAHIFSGGEVVATSDDHFGSSSNLLLPGRGIDMGDGWETKRSHAEDHQDWVTIKLGAPGYLITAIIDTIHFKGNFPESCDIRGICSREQEPDVNNGGWKMILSPVKLGPHLMHFFQLNSPCDQYTHVKVSIYPDGGIKRVRIIGTLAAKPDPDAKETIAQEDRERHDIIVEEGWEILEGIEDADYVRI